MATGDKLETLPLLDREKKAEFNDTFKTETNTKQRRAELATERVQVVREAFVGSIVKVTGVFSDIWVNGQAAWWKADGFGFPEPGDEVTDHEVIILAVEEIDPEGLCETNHFSNCFAILTEDRSGVVRVGHLNAPDGDQLGLTITSNGPQDS